MITILIWDKVPKVNKKPSGYYDFVMLIHKFKARAANLIIEDSL